MSYYEALLAQVKLPRLVCVQQNIESHRLEHVTEAVRAAIEGFPRLERVRGKQVALAVGSRGIANLVEIVAETVACLRRRGAEVFLVPAMGSHGGADAANQELLLRHLGICEETVGAPIRSSMETVVLCRTEDGVPVHFDKNAAQADYTVSIARIKPHSSFRGRYESGMVKMCVIGLGKQRGADYCHQQGMERMAQNLEKIGRASIPHSNLLFSLGLIEDGRDDTARVLAIPAEEILEAEPALLEEAKGYLPRIPLGNLDVLVVDEFGKNITGTGMDSNIIQRFTSEYRAAQPVAKRVVTLRLTPESDGNASGFGLADISTRRAFEAMSFEKTYPNSLTARTVRGCMLPMIMESDYDAIRAAVKTAPAVDYDHIRLLRLRNTLRMEQFAISEALLPEAERTPGLRICSEPFEWGFDSQGNLMI